MPERLGVLIKEARTGKGLTLRELEALVGVSNAHLSQLETGAISQPSMALLYAVAEALELDYAMLLSLAGHTTKVGPGSAAVVGAAFQGASDLTADEVEEVQRFIDIVRRRKERSDAGTD